MSVNPIDDFHRHVERLADIVFNKRRASEAGDKKVTVGELIRRGSSVIRVGGKTYSVEVKEITR